MFNIKKICSIFLLFFTFITNIFSWLPPEDQRWSYITSFKNGTIFNAYVDVRNEALERQTGWINHPSGWIATADVPQMNGAVLPVGNKAEVEPGKQVSFSEVGLHWSGAAANSKERRVRFSGSSMGDDLGLSASDLLVTEPLMGSAFLWMKNRINGSKALIFEAKTEDEFQVVLGSARDNKPLVRVIVNQNEVKILTEAEYLEYKKMDFDGKSFICYGDEVYLKNERSGNVLNNNGNMVKLDGKATSDKIWCIDPVFQDLDILEPYRTVALRGKATNNYITGLFGGNVGFAPRWDRFELWYIANLENRKDKRIKDGDRVLFEAVDQIHKKAKLTEEWNVAKIRWDWQTDFKVWKVYLANQRNLNFPKITKEQNPDAFVPFGSFGVFWINVNNNSVWFGSGNTLGMNTLLYKKLPQDFDGKLTFLGFSSNAKRVDFRNFIESDAVVLKKTNRVYAKIENQYNISNPAGTYTWVDKSFRSLHQGAVSFSASTKDFLSVAFASDKDDTKVKYVVEIEKEQIKIYKKIKDKLEQKALGYFGKNPLNLAEQSEYLISNKSGFITVEKDKDLLLVWQDSNPEKECKYLGFSGNAQISEVSIIPSVKIDTLTMTEVYKKAITQYKEEKDKRFNLVKNYAYSVRQAGNKILLTDEVYKNETYNLVGLREGGEHLFRAEVKPNGDFDFGYAQAPRGDVAKPILDSLSRANATIASGVSAAGSSIMTQDPRIGGMLMGAGIGLSAASVAVNEISNIVFAPTEGIYTEATRFMTSASYSLEETERRKTEIAKYMNELEGIDINIDINSENGFGLIIDRLNEVINRIIAPDMITLAVKDRILQIIKKLFIASDEREPGNYNALLMLFIKTYDNRFLLDPYNNKDKNALEDLYIKIDTIAERLFIAIDKGFVEFIEIPAFHGEFVWYPYESDLDEVLTVYVKAEALKDLIICFGAEREEVQKIGMSKELPSVLIGSFNNNATGIAFDNNFGFEKILTKKENPDIMASPIEPKEYYFSFNKGLINFGIINDGQPINIKELEVKDEYYNLKGKIFAGISCWDSPVKIYDIRIGNSIKDILDKKAMEQKSLAQQESVQEAGEVVQAEESGLAPEVQEVGISQDVNPMPQEYSMQNN